MADDDGFSVAGELQVGGYAALEGDLGDSLAGPLGFSAPAVEWESDGLVFAAAGFSTVRALVAFTVRGVSC
jgi:hypothetical protein